MMQEAIKQLWRAETRSEATKALDIIEYCLGGELDGISGIEFDSLMRLIKAKNSKLINEG